MILNYIERYNFIIEISPFMDYDSVRYKNMEALIENLKENDKSYHDERIDGRMLGYYKVFFDKRLI